MAKQTFEAENNALDATTNTEYPGIEAAQAEPVSSVVECSTGEETPKEKGKNIFATACGAVHKGIYSSVYTLTYGVVYGSMMVAELLPGNNVIGEGVRDGYAAAKKAYSSRSGKIAAEDMNVAMGESAVAA